MRGRIYADSSALVKLVIDEPESDALRALVGSGPGLVTSWIAVVEVHRAAHMAHPSARSQPRTKALLDRCRLLAVSADVLERARQLASPRLRSLDAIHLASAIRSKSPQIVTYDRRLMEAASAEGLRVLHPGLAA